MVVFAIVQLFCFYKGGMVFSPWYNYGMYSAVMRPDTLYTVYGIKSKWPDNKRLISPQSEDKIFVTLDQYYNLPANDSFYHNEVKRIFLKAHLPLPDSNRFKNSIAEQTFRHWFSQYSACWAKDSFQQPQQARWDGYRLQLIQNPVTP